MPLWEDAHRDRVGSTPRGRAAVEVQTIVPPSPELWFAIYDIDSGEYRNNPAYRDMKKDVIDGMLASLEQVYPGASTRKDRRIGTPAS